MKNTIYDPIDMVSMLSQITIKVPLSKMFRIEEHKKKALSWLGGIQDNNVVTQEPTITQQILVLEKEKEENGVMSQIPQMYLDNSSFTYL